MMMMDVGMYGHGQHSAPYASNAENYYGNYAGEACPQSNQIPTAHYGPGYPYEESSFPYSSENAETPPSPQSLNNYYHHPHQHVPQDNPIISTEAGLSYTNLDYGANPSISPTSSVYNPAINHQPIYNPDSYHQRTSSELMLDNHHHGAYLPDNKYLGQIDPDSYAHHPHSNSSSCMEYQHHHHHRFKEEGLSGADLEHRLHQPAQQHSLHNLSSVPQPQPVIPTYKWMQVKRNVPKPAGKSL